jgi:hypothetical protein
MSQHPINLALRFLLEIIALVILGIWGWRAGEGWMRFVLALGIPVGAAALWGTFRVPNDPGKAPVPVPGIVRLTLEMIYFGFATWALYDMGTTLLSWIFGLVVILHYMASSDRIRWLISGQRREG